MPVQREGGKNRHVCMGIIMLLGQCVISLKGL